VSLAVLCQIGRNCKRAAFEVEQIVGHLEPDLLPRSDHSGQLNESRRVLGTPRRELPELLGVKRATLSRRVTDWLDGENRLVYALTSSSSVLEDTLQELKFVLG
jgi:hypothetical protein